MSFISNEDSSILPYNDDNARYDIDKRRYILTKTGLINLAGVDISKYTDSQQEQEMYLDEFSLDVYDFIYENTLPSSVKYKRFRLAKYEEYRKLILEIIALHARGSLRSGSFLLKDQHGVNIEKGKAIGLENIRGEITISGSAVRAMKRDKNLLYLGNDYIHGFYDDGTY